MTDKVIKSLEWLILNFPKTIPAQDNTDRLINCINLYCQNAVDELNRQKAEIDRLQKNYDKAMDNLKAVLEERADHSEAITEFAERVTKELYEADDVNPLTEYKIDQIAKEMKGEQ